MSIRQSFVHNRPVTDLGEKRGERAKPNMEFRNKSEAVMAFMATQPLVLAAVTHSVQMKQLCNVSPTTLERQLLTSAHSETTEPAQPTQGGRLPLSVQDIWTFFLQNTTRSNPGFILPRIAQDSTEWIQVENVSDKVWDLSQSLVAATSVDPKHFVVLEFQGASQSTTLTATRQSVWRQHATGMHTYTVLSYLSVLGPERYTTVVARDQVLSVQLAKGDSAYFLLQYNQPTQ
jgi:hypothetical protein